MHQSGFLRTALLLCISFGLLATARAAAPGPYTLTDLGDLPGGTNFSEAHDINAQGQVVGSSNGAGGVQAFIWTPTSQHSTTGTMAGVVALPPGPTPGDALTINGQGQIAGQTTFGAVNHAFLWSPTTPNGTTGTIVDLGDIVGGADSSAGVAINSYGQVGGLGVPGTGGNHVVLWTPNVANGTTGTLQDLGDLPGGNNQSIGFGINDYGQVVGEGNTFSLTHNPETHAIVWTPTSANGTTGSLVDLGPGTAAAINSTGRITGYNAAGVFLWTPATANGTTGSLQSLGFSATPIDVNGSASIVGVGGSGPSSFAFIWTASSGELNLNSLLDTSYPGWTLRVAEGINDYGQIVGYGTYDPDGPSNGVDPVTRAFLLTPVPEPATLGSIVVFEVMMIRRRLR